MRDFKLFVSICALALALGLGAAGCEVEEDDGDATQLADVTVGDTGGGGGDTGEEPCPDPNDCGEDNYCNPDCVDSGTQIPTDFDCNVNTPENSTKPTVNPKCNCDYWGFVCEASTKCSTTPCACDPDCLDICDGGGLITACNSDGHCDTWCTTNTDPDCTGDPDNGKYCN